jgi:hypothetical protein
MTGILALALHRALAGRGLPLSQQQQIYPALARVTFNQYICSGIEELRDTIRFACALAATYPPDGLPYASVRPTRYTPSSQPFVHGLAHLERRLSLPAGQLELALG